MAGKNKTYELMLKIGGKVDGSLKTACNTADKNMYFVSVCIFNTVKS